MSSQFMHWLQGQSTWMSLLKLRVWLVMWSWKKTSRGGEFAPGHLCSKDMQPSTCLLYLVLTRIRMWGYYSVRAGLDQFFRFPDRKLDEVIPDIPEYLCSINNLFFYITVSMNFSIRGRCGIRPSANYT